MTDRFDNFRSLASTDPAIAERFAAHSTRVSALARELLEVDLDPASLIEVDSVRVASITGELDEERALLEVSRLQKVTKLRAEREQTAKLKAADVDALEAIYRLPAARRMSRMRELGVDDLVKKAPVSSIADSATLYKQALAMRPANRISFLRKHGLA